jgi:hypothetical protein
MKIPADILKGLLVAALLLNIVSCCCTGATNDTPTDTNIVAPGQHNEGTGGDV